MERDVVARQPRGVRSTAAVRTHGKYTRCFGSSHGIGSGIDKKIWKRLVVIGNLYDTGYGYGSKEMQSMGVLTVRPTDRHKVNPHLGVVLVGL